MPEADPSEHRHRPDSAGYRLEQLNTENASSWDQFNTSSPEGSIFHSLKWKQLAEKCSDISCQYFLLFKDDEVVGLFPFIDHTIHTFRGLIPANNPMSLHAVLKDDTDSCAMQYVLRELQKFFPNRKKLSFISVSTLHKETLDAIPGYRQFPYAGDGDMVVDLTESCPEAIWNSLSSPRRKTIRRFDKQGYEITEVRSEDDLRIFYHYYEANIRHIGGTLQPFSHFADLRSSLSDDIRITLLSKGPLVAGGLLQLQDKPQKTVYSVYLALNRELPAKFSPTYYLDWEAITWACEHNCEKFSFGTEYLNDLNESNPRYRLKRAFGGQFKPVYTSLIPLTRLFSMGVKYTRLLRNRRDH